MQPAQALKSETNGDAASTPSFGGPPTQPALSSPLLGFVAGSSMPQSKQRHAVRTRFSSKMALKICMVASLNRAIRLQRETEGKAMSSGSHAAG